MEQKKYMAISEFARLTGIKRANLIFYDKIGLLCPEYRGENEYRYYSGKQLNSAYLITSLRELGLSLKDIGEYASVRTPKKMTEMFEVQERRIEEEIVRLRKLKDMMNIYTEMAEESLRCNEDEVCVKVKEKETVFLGLLYDPSKEQEENSLDFFYDVWNKGMELGYPFGGMIAKETLQRGACDLVLRYYLKVKHGHNGYKPAGKYATACGRCSYGKSDFVYERLFVYIKENNLKICGDAYEEYLLNEMSLPDDEQFFVRVEIMVEE